MRDRPSLSADKCFDGTMMVKLSMDACNLETKATMQMLRSKSSGAKSAKFHNCIASKIK